MEFSSIAFPTAYAIPPFAANLGSLLRLPINTSYASSTSINISGLNYKGLNTTVSEARFLEQRHLSEKTKAGVVKYNSFSIYSTNFKQFCSRHYSVLKKSSCDSPYRFSNLSYLNNCKINH